MTALVLNVSPLAFQEKALCLENCNPFHVFLSTGAILCRVMLGPGDPESLLLPSSITAASLARCRKLGAVSDEAVELAGRARGERATILNTGEIFIVVRAGRRLNVCL